jgi:hypothetical protein
MGAFRSAIALAGRRTVELPDSRRIKDARIYRHSFVTKHLVQRFQATLDTSPILTRSFDSIEQVATVSAVANDRIRPAFGSQIGCDFLGAIQCGLMFFISRADTGQSNRIKIDGQPDSAENLSVSRCSTLLNLVSPIGPAGKEIWEAWIQGEVITLRCFRTASLSDEGFYIVEVATEGEGSI